MSLAIDPNYRWRSAGLAGIPVKYVEHGDVRRGRAEGAYAPEAAVTDATVAGWLEHLDARLLSENDARNGMMTGTLAVDIEVGSMVTKSADNAIGLLHALPYDYSGAKVTQMHLTYAGKHFVVRPRMDETVLSAMYSAPSVDKWVTAAGIKLPRVNAVTTANTIVPGMPSASAGTSAPTTTRFEGLRRMATLCAKGDDYGDRLFALARIVCHARVTNTLRVSHDSTPAMVSGGSFYSILTADTPNLSAADLRDNVYLYTHTDDTDDYRAFLTMGVRGLQNYAGGVPTIYSECRVEVEAKPDDAIVFVRVGGEAPGSNFTVPEGAYRRVLDNPDACLAYYYAYSRSMGLGDMATAVLVQAAIAPHIWGTDAISPYKNCRPKLDACRYTILPSDNTAHCAVPDSRAIVYQAAIIAQSLKAAYGCLFMGFSAGHDVDSAGVVSQYMHRLADPETRRLIARTISSRYCNGNVGLDWLTPFSYDPQVGFQACVSAWRDHGYLLARFTTCPVSSISACLAGGVDMTNSLIGRQTVLRSNTYAQVVMCCLAAGVQLPGMCERITAGLLGSIMAVVPRLREWRPVVTIVRFSGAHPRNEKLEDSPGTWPKDDLKSNSDQTTTTTTSPEPLQATVATSLPVSHRRRVSSPSPLSRMRSADVSKGTTEQVDSEDSMPPIQTRIITRPRGTKTEAPVYSDTGSHGRSASVSTKMGKAISPMRNMVPSTHRKLWSDAGDPPLGSWASEVDRASSEGGKTVKLKTAMEHQQHLSTGSDKSMKTKYEDVNDMAI